jgi:NADH-quinone oxidoreductase subunit A
LASFTMNAADGPVPMLWPLALYGAAAVALVGSLIGLSALLGERHRGRATGEPYEAGMVPTGSAQLRFGAGFYLVAMFFVIFDLEAAFLFAWAVAARELGGTGYIGMLLFVGVLAVALFYEWRVGALDWAAAGTPLTPRGSAPRRVMEDGDRRASPPGGEQE